MKFNLYVVFAALLLLSACTALRETAVPAENKLIPKEERVVEVRAVSSWELSGAIAARSKQKAWSASLNWLQKDISNYQIRLFGPLGSGTVIIDKKGNLVTYRDGPKTASSTDAAALLLQQTGVRLPVNNLYFWVRGIAAPGSVAATVYDKFNHVSQLRQGGYIINYLRYTSVNGKDLPSKIELSGQDLTVKLVVKTWKI